MNRRQLIAVLGAGVTGCAGRNTDAPTTESDPPAATETASDVDGTQSETSGPNADVRTYAAYRFTYETDLLGVVPPNREQFAFVTLPDSAPTPPLSAFSLKLGSNRYSPAELNNRFNAAMPDFPWGKEGIYFNNNKSGPILFDVPRTDVDEAVLTDGTHRYPLPAVDQFGSVASFTVESIQIPETIKTPGVEVTLTVSNDGDRSEFFLGGVWISGYPKPINLQVQPGEQASTSVSYPNFGSGDVTVVHANGTVERTVERRTETATG